MSADLTLMNLPKFVARADLKKKYHLLAKQCHPDLHSAAVSEAHQRRLQDKFKNLNEAYNRLLLWCDERDGDLEQALREGTHPSGFRTEADGEVTFKIGKIQMRASRRDLDKQKLLAEMIEDELVLGEPLHFVRWLACGWLLLGLWYLQGDWRAYRGLLASRIEN